MGALMLASTPPAHAQSACSVLIADEARLNREAATLLSGNPAASHAVATCGLQGVQGGTLQTVQFAGCASTACLMKGAVMQCATVALDWRTLIERRNAVVARKKAQGC